jgi:HD-GYP domain-containing protein (c-di-GMP phosphodiesterase class II)
VDEFEEIEEIEEILTAIRDHESTTSSYLREAHECDLVVAEIVERHHEANALLPTE